MSRCISDNISLDPIKIVSDHLSERVKLDCSDDTIPFYNFTKNGSLVKLSNKSDCRMTDPERIHPNKSNNTPNALMFARSMFLMNDEPRHFLAPHIGAVPEDHEYPQLQKSIPEKFSDGKPIKLRPHSCEECGKSFLMKHHLVTHVRVHTGERPHVCPECGKTFALKHCLSTHLLLHSSERPYQCNECSKTFTLKHHLVSHEKIHSRDKPFECRECGQTFAQKRHLSTHLKYHAGERPFSCQVCGETFSRKEHLIMHSRFHGGTQPYICPDCGAGFLRKFQLVEHERQHGRVPESCPVCGKEFLQKRTLLLHVRTCGVSNNNPNFPANCPPQPANTGALPSATVVYVSGVQPSLTKHCKECGESFSSAEGLALHQRLHDGDSSFIADICSLAASLKNATHSNHPALSAVASANPFHQVVINKKSFPCPHCNRGFSQRHGVTQHLIRYPNGSCKLKPYACAKCGKAFSQKNHLVLHERQHMEPEQRSELKARLASSQQRLAAAAAKEVQQTLQQEQHNHQQTQHTHQQVQPSHQQVHSNDASNVQIMQVDNNGQISILQVSSSMPNHSMQANSSVQNNRQIGNSMLNASLHSSNALSNSTIHPNTKLQNHNLQNDNSGDNTNIQNSNVQSNSGVQVNTLPSPILKNSVSSSGNVQSGNVCNNTSTSERSSLSMQHLQSSNIQSSNCHQNSNVPNCNVQNSNNINTNVHTNKSSIQSSASLVNSAQNEDMLRHMLSSTGDQHVISSLQHKSQEQDHQNM